jgi:hypothetical protein
MSINFAPAHRPIACPSPVPSHEFELPGPADAAGRDDDRLGLEGHELTGRAPIRDAPGDSPLTVVHELEDLALHEDVGVHRDDLLLERADQFQAGAVADVREAGVAVTTEVALEYLAVLGPVEERPPLLEFPDPVRRLLGVQFGHAVVVQVLAAAHGVTEVHHPVVLRIDVAHRRGDAALGHDRVRLAEERLRDDAHREAALLGFDRGAQTGATGADYQYVVGVVFVRGVGHCRPSRKACSR